LEGFAAAQQFGINLGKLFDQFHKLGVSGGASAGLLLLVGSFEKELTQAPGRQAEGQIIIGAVFLALVAGAGGFATSEELLDAGGAQEIGRWAQLLEESALALAQSEGGFAFEFEYPSHNNG